MLRSWSRNVKKSI